MTETTMKSMRSLVVLGLCLFSIARLQAQTKKLTTAEAEDHVGDGQGRQHRERSCDM